MNRRAFLGASTGLGIAAVTGGFLGRNLLRHDLTMDWGYGKLHDSDDGFVEGGLSDANPKTQYFAAVLTSEPAAKRLNAETVGEGMSDLMATDFDEQFFLVVESRTTAENPFLVAPVPGENARNGIWSIHAELVRNPVELTDATETSSLVYSSVTVVDRDSLPAPNDVRIDVYESAHGNRRLGTFRSD
jgi:hypothetical protein